MFIFQKSIYDAIKGFYQIRGYDFVDKLSLFLVAFYSPFLNIQPIFVFYS